MYKVRIMQVNVNEPLVMWIVSNTFDNVYFIDKEKDSEFGTYAGNDFGWQPCQWFKYL